MRKVDFDNKIECLLAKNDPVIISLYQPVVRLSIDGNSGPHYDPALRDNEIAKIKQFIILSGDQGAKLIVFPEYTVPIEILLQILKGEINVANGTLLVLPLEGMKYERYVGIKEEIGSSTCSCITLPAEDRLSGGFVNVCAIVALIDGDINVYFQPKRFPSQIETQALCTGSEYFIFIGRGIALTVLVCADANEYALFSEQVTRTKEVTGTYFVHTQWNTEPKYDFYDNFWRLVISTPNHNAVLLSTNVATGSSIKEDEKIRVIVPSVRLACSGEGRRDQKYMNIRRLVAFKSLFARLKYGETFDFAYPFEAAHFMEIRRPYEGAMHGANTTKDFLHSCKTFKLSGEFEELTKDFFIDQFNKSLQEESRELELAEHLRYVEDFTLEDREILISSCLRDDKYKWLERDLLLRPVVWLTFYKEIVPRSNVRPAAEAVDCFVQCLVCFSKCAQQGYKPMLLSDVNFYPLNLINQERKFGWIFHCKGASAFQITKDIALFLRPLLRAPFSLNLYPVKCDHDLTRETIIKASISPKEGKPLISFRDYDITDPNANVDLEVISI